MKGVHFPFIAAQGSSFSIYRRTINALQFTLLGKVGKVRPTITKFASSASGLTYRTYIAFQIFYRVAVFTTTFAYETPAATFLFGFCQILLFYKFPTVGLFALLASSCASKAFLTFQSSSF